MTHRFVVKGEWLGNTNYATEASLYSACSATTTSGKSDFHLFFYHGVTEPEEYSCVASLSLVLACCKTMTAETAEYYRNTWIPAEYRKALVNPNPGSAGTPVSVSIALFVSIPVFR